MLKCIIDQLKRWNIKIKWEFNVKSDSKYYCNMY